MASQLEVQDVVGEWKKEKVLGTGGFGMVVLWSNTSTNQYIALKQIRWANDPMLTLKHKQRWAQEVDIMQRLSHPNVIAAVDVPSALNVASDDLPLLAMEYCTGGDLRKVLARPENCFGLSELEMRTLLSHVSSALRYLHSLRIIHRDLKPENIVLKEVDGKMVYKLIDLGYAKELDQSSMCTSFVGTLQYLAPELFMSQKYTSTVDYWSLGLVAHECITGVRPFLPNWSPAQWIPHVMKKSPEHICAYLGLDGHVIFSSELVPENRISKPLKKYIEGWLAVMLEWDPQNRGCVLKDGKKEVIAFTMLDDIINKKIITVFHVHTCQYLWYEVNETTTMSHVVHWISTDIKVPKENLLFLLQQGSPLDVKKRALQYWTEPEDEDWILFVFDIRKEDMPQINPKLPEHVDKLLRMGAAAIGYEDHRKLWTQSLFFIHQERDIYRRLVQAQKVLMMHLLSRNSIIYNTTTKMVRELNKLKAKLELFESSLSCDIQKYESQAQNGGITSNLMFQNWVRNQDISKKIVHLQEKVVELEGKATVVNTKTIELQRSPYARNKVSRVLDEIFEKAVIEFDAMRKRPKEHRQSPAENTETMTLIIACLKHKDHLMRDIYLHIRKLLCCIDDVQELINPMETMLTDINEHEKLLDVIQRERQTDIWKLVENLCKKIRAIKTSARQQGSVSTEASGLYNSAKPRDRYISLMDNSFATSGSSDSCNVRESLSSAVASSFQETPSLVSENARLHKELQTAQDHLFEAQDEAKSLFDTSDWDFLSPTFKATSNLQR